MAPRRTAGTRPLLSAALRFIDRLSQPVVVHAHDTGTNPTYVQSAFRGRYDDGNESGANWIANENTNWTQDVDLNFRVRIEVEETATATQNNTPAFRLQYNLGGAGWNNVTNASSVVRIAASPFVTDGAATTNQLTTSARTFQAGEFDEGSGITATQAAMANESTDIEFCVQIRSGDVADGNTVQLRLTDNGTVLTTYSQTPSITVSKKIVPKTKGNGGGASSFNTASHTPGANKLQILCVNSRFGTPAPTASGNGLTWSQVATVGDSDSGYVADQRLTVLSAKGVSPSAGATTIDFGGTSQETISWWLFEVEDTASHSAVVQSATNKSTATPASLAVNLSAFANSNNYVLGFWAAENGGTMTPELALLAFGNESGGPCNRPFFRRTEDSTPTVTFAGSTNCMAIAIEIGQEPPTATIASTLDEVSASLTAFSYKLDIASTIDEVQASLTVSSYKSDIASVLDELIADLQASQDGANATIASTLAEIAASLAASNFNDSVIVSALTELAMSATATMEPEGAITSVLDEITDSLAASNYNDAVIVAVVDGVESALTATQSIPLTIASTLDETQGSFTVAQVYEMTVAVLLDELTAELNAAIPNDSTIEAILDEISFATTVIATLATLANLRALGSKGYALTAHRQLSGAKARNPALGGGDTPSRIRVRKPSFGSHG